MKFPTVGDIATLSVVSIDKSDTLKHAIAIMIECEHRNIVIKDNNNFSVLNVLDVVNFQNQNYDLQIKLSELNLPAIPTIRKNQNILETLDIITYSEFICVINNDNSLYGLVSHSDITANIDPETLMENYRLKDFFKIGRKVNTVMENEITSNIFIEMVKFSYDNVIVISDMKPIGILTTKNIMKLIKSKSDLSLPIKAYMVSPVDTVNNSTSIKNTLEFLKVKHYKRVVVVDEKGYFVGVIYQSELISLTYSNWASLMKKYQNELNEINNILENKNREYETLASTDALTGLYNRYKFSELFISSYKTMLQRNNKMSLIMLDIDYFKKVNDTYGHNVGDKVLVQVAHCMLQVLRNVDIIGRWGGEEFVMLLPTADLKNASILAEKIRYEIEHQEIDIAGKITVSMGVCEIKVKTTLEENIKEADDALYLAKKSGRNCVKTSKDLKF